MEAARAVGCACCGGPVVAGGESQHPCGLCVQHGRCAHCGASQWRLLDEQREPLTDPRGYWKTSTDGPRHPVRRMSAPTRRATRPRRRPAHRDDRSRPRS